MLHRLSTVLGVFVLFSSIAPNATAQDATRRPSRQPELRAGAHPGATATVERWLFAADRGDDDHSSTLYRIGITPASGAVGVEVVGETGYEDILDIAFMGDRLMAVGTGKSFGIDDDVLFEIDPETATTTAIGTMDYPGSMNALEGETATTLLGATTEGELWRIDLASLTKSRIGVLGSGLVSSGDLTFAHDGTLLVTVNGFFSDSLATVDRSTGRATTIGSTGYDEVYGLATHPESGALLGVVDAASSPKLATIQRSTGDASVIGRIPLSTEITGLAVRPAALAVNPEFSWTPFAPKVGQEVQFTDESSGSPDTWRWDFGDGATSTARNPKHVFAAAGTFNVRLVVSRGGSGAASVTQSVSVAADSTMIVITGKVMVGGVRIVGGGTTYRRKVQVFDANGQRRGEQDLASDGSYSIVVPRGRYTAVASIEYRNDTADLEGSPTRSAESGRTGCDGTAPCDIAFRNPIVFVHGFKLPLADGRTRWNLWRGSLPSDVISFVPRYSILDSAEQAAEVLTEDLAEDFEMFSEAPRFDIIAHSKGGLVSRVLKNQATYGQRITSVALLGTPNSGVNCYGSGLAGLSWCDLEDFNTRYPDFPGNVFVVAGTAGSLCAAEGTAPSDGVVPVDSVFNVSRRDGSAATGHTFPGVIVPQKHTELGTTEPWLLEKIILPAFGGAALPRCPDPAYETAFRTCSIALPLRPSTNQCISGYGLIDSDGDARPGCTIPNRQDVFGVQLRWQSPLTSGGAPRNVQSTIARFENPCPAAPANAVSTKPSSSAAGAHEGYAVLRAKVVEGQSVEAIRVGWVPASQTSFIDPAPLTGTSQYWVVAVYEESESTRAASPVVTVSPSRRRTVRH